MKGFFGVALAAMSLAVPASANCSLKNLAGTWAAYGLVSSALGDNLAATCTLVISSSGQISSNSTCGATPAQVQLQAAGSFKLTSASNCAFAGTIRIPWDTSIYQITQMTLAADGKSVTGAGIHGSINYVASAISGLLINMSRLK